MPLVSPRALPLRRTQNEPALNFRLWRTVPGARSLVSKIDVVDDSPLNTRMSPLTGVVLSSQFPALLHFPSKAAPVHVLVVATRVEGMRAARRIRRAIFMSSP